MIGLIIFAPPIQLCFCGWSLHCVSSQLRKDLVSCESSVFCSKDCSWHTQRNQSFFCLDKISENYLNCLLSLLKGCFKKNLSSYQGGKTQQVEHVTKSKGVKNNFKSRMWNFPSWSIFSIIDVTGSLFLCVWFLFPPLSPPPTPLPYWICGQKKDENMIIKSKSLIMFLFDLNVTHG